VSFDDASQGQDTSALPILRRHRFVATFVVMTVVLDKPGWLSRAQVRRLDRLGMTIAAPSWDHQPVPSYQGGDWRSQLSAPARELGRLVGHRVRLFAYPYGRWTRAAFPHLQGGRVPGGVPADGPDGPERAAMDHPAHHGRPHLEPGDPAGPDRPQLLTQSAVIRPLERARAGNSSGNRVVVTVPAGMQRGGRQSQLDLRNASVDHQADGPLPTSNP
jgi:hypothetical protein